MIEALRRLASAVRRRLSGDPDMERRLVILMNTSANMSRGKYAAQAVHAALNLTGSHPGTPVIVLGASQSKIAELPVQIRDAGRTEVAPGTLTAGAKWDYRAKTKADDQS